MAGASIHKGGIGMATEGLENEVVQILKLIDDNKNFLLSGGASPGMVNSPDKRRALENFINRTSFHLHSSFRHQPRKSV